MMQKNLTSLCFLLISQSAFSLPIIQEAFIKNYPHLKATALESCTTCHMPNIRNGLNRYALDLKKARMNFKKIQALDSDKDGVSNIKELKQKLLPGTKNSLGSTLFVYKNSKGKVHFNHEAHITVASYNISYSCNKCHSKQAFKKEFRGTKNFSGIAHKLCLDCHTRTAPNSTKAAIKCIDCHTN